MAHLIPDRFADSHEITLPRDLEGSWQMAVSCLRYRVQKPESPMDEQRVVVTPVDVAEGVAKPSFVLKLNRVPLFDFGDVMREMVTQLQLVAWALPSHAVYRDVYEILVRRFVLFQGVVWVLPGRRRSKNYYRFAFSESVREFLGFAADPVVIVHPVASNFKASRPLNTPSIRNFTVSSSNIQRDLTMGSGELLNVPVSGGWGDTFDVSFDGDRLDYKPISDRCFKKVSLIFSADVRVLYVCLVLKPSYKSHASS